ncbi:MAG: macro domain-containing protein [Candidatus Riflebacteria bacterium]|nr:macro domain-containing protein [Candidatus Riflebacteria bacterium]
MPLFIINDDITNLKVDAIVNAANNSLLGGGGVDGCIHRAAGPDLLKECITLRGCETGDAKITKGYKLPAKYVIHTVGPIWRGGRKGEEELLKSCYNRCLQIAVENKCGSVAFPMISAGVYGYPKYEAMQVAKNTINSFLEKLEDDLDVYIVLFGRDISGFFEPEDGLNDFLNSRIPDLFDSIKMCSIAGMVGEATNRLFKTSSKESRKICSERMSDLGDILKQPDESFSSMVMRKIKESGLNEVSCYKAANVNKQIFSKIRSCAGEDETETYQPTKSTAMSFAIALKLPLDESKELLRKAGYAFSRSDKTDIIVEYCITNRIYDIFRVNEILFTYEQPVLGSKCH